MTLARGQKLKLDGEVVTVVAVTSEAPSLVELVISNGDGHLRQVSLAPVQLEAALVPTHDGRGDPGRVLSATWAKWMEWAVRQIRSTVTATRPLRPFAHQDEAVFGKMLPQPKLRFLLADEPGTGKTIMTGMYLVEGRRRGLIPGRTVIVVPAHLVGKWLRDLRRYFGVEAMRITSEVGRQPQDLRPDIDVWVVSLDLFARNADVQRKIVGRNASWALAVFDEAHRLTPTSQYLEAAHRLGDVAHHLLLLTATPHRGKEHYFRGLLNLLNPGLYPWDERTRDYGEDPLRPSELSFLRRMKEELRDVDGTPLFPPRNAETLEVLLSATEEDAYTAVMTYVDEWYPDHAVLARSIYGKRAASSAVAARATLGRRQAALESGDESAVTITPPGYDDPHFRSADFDDDEAWDDAERAIVGTRSRDRQRELRELQHLIDSLDNLIESGQEPSKWLVAKKKIEQHGIRPGAGQLLVFTEFTDTAEWLARLFRNAGFTTEVLKGADDHLRRDALQQAFLNGDFQVLVSTDAGGEGIDLQSAHVMFNWDIPWSLVRLEQRMGRLHRIGQENEVFIYHLVAPATREGRVQQVMLSNIELAAQALHGRIFDLLDATAANAGFDYAAALAEAQRGSAGPGPAVPSADDLIRNAKEVVRREDRFHAPVSVEAAQRRFADDRLQAINPVIVTAFMRQLASTQHWSLENGPFPKIYRLESPRGLPKVLGGNRRAFIAADGEAVAKARVEGLQTWSDVIVLGPTEPAFRELVWRAAQAGEQDLSRGAAVVDTASLTGYTLFLFSAELHEHDGLRAETIRYPFLIRYSGSGAFHVAWESLLNVSPDATADAARRAPPAAEQDAQEAARAHLEDEVKERRSEKAAWVVRARNDLEAYDVRYRDQLAHRSVEERRQQLAAFAELKRERLAQLDRSQEVRVGAPQLVGWMQVRGGARPNEVGSDPDSEVPAIHVVVAELERLGYYVDDRQTAGLGYDLFARHPRTQEQRLVEVKGLKGDLSPVTLERHEWGQAQQRGADYWLYVVTDCSTQPTVRIRLQDPAEQLSGAPRQIERYRIPVSELRRFDRQ